MTAELSPEEINGRFKYLNPPFPLPGKCAVCGNVRTPVVDFGATVDYYGALLICERCVVQAYSLLTKIGVVEVPQSVPAEAYEAIANDLKENLNATVLSLTSLLNGCDVLNRNLADEITQRCAEDSEGASGEVSDSADGTNDETSDDAGDEGSISVSSRRTTELGIAGL